MKRIFFITISIILTMGIVIMSHCSKEEEAVIINDNVQLPEDNPDLSDVIVKGDTVLLIYKSGSSLPEFDPNDLVVGQEDGGYLKKVVTATPKGDTVDLLTEQATLTDVVVKGSVDTTFTLTAQGPPMAPIIIDTTITGSSGKTYNVNFTGGGPNFLPMGDIFEIRIPNVSIEIYDGSNLAVSITIDTLILSKSIDLNLNIEINSGAISNFSLVASASDDVGFRGVIMDIRQSISDDIEIKLTTINLGTVVAWIGPVPVVFIFEFGIYAGIDASVTVSASTEIANNVDLTSTNEVGAEYASGSWQGINTWTLDGNGNIDCTPSVSINATLSNYLRGSLDAKIYGVIGPTLYLKPYQYNTISYPPYSYDLGVGLGAGLGFKVEILDWLLAEFNYTFIDYTKSLLSAQEGTLKWRYQTGGNVHSSPAIGSDGTIYVGSFDDYLYALNPDGTLQWRHQTGDDVVSSPAIGSDGTIYVGSMDDYLYALNPDGTLKWRYQAAAYVVSSPAISIGGSVYFVCDMGNIYALKSDGSLEWCYQTGAVGSSPAIGSDGTIYVGSMDDYLYAINPNGTLKWLYLTGGRVESSPAIGSDGTIYVGSEDYYLYAINPNGTLKWRYLTGDWVQSSPAIGSDGTIYVGSGDDYLYAINSNGTLKWRYLTGNRVVSSPGVGSNGTIYVGSEDTYLYAINPNGTLKWRYQIGSYYIAPSSPAIGSDGTIYIGSKDGYFYALWGAGQLANTPWPMFHHDLKHTGRVGGGF